jgi:hypothetical protein
MTRREILDAIQALPRPDRLRLVERLNEEAWSDQAAARIIVPPDLPSSQLPPEVTPP